MSELQDNDGGRFEDHVDRVVQQWAQVRPHLDTAPMALVARLGRAASYADARINEGLSAFGLTRPSWDVLASLRRSGEPYRLSPTTLYRGLMRTSGAMTHRLARLQRAGLIRRVADPGDNRSRLVELTPKGLALVDRIAPVHLENERRLLSPLDRNEQRELAALLKTLLGSLERDRPVPPPSGAGGRHRRRQPKRAE
jgi:DNA-binding MarR family transcriptional regulator